MTIPKIQSALNGWESRITFVAITQTIDNRGIASDTPTTYRFKGVIQPLKPEQLQAKPEGKRSWKAWQVHTRTKLSFNTGDKIQYLNKTYEVEANNDYNLNGYYEYHLLKDYE